MSVNVGKDARSDPKFLLEKLGSFDFASAGAGGAGEKGLEALNGLKQTLAQVWNACYNKGIDSNIRANFSPASCVIPFASVFAVRCALR